MTTTTKPYSSRYQRAVKRVLAIQARATRLLGSLPSAQQGTAYEASLTQLIRAADLEIAAMARAEKLAVVASN